MTAPDKVFRFYDFEFSTRRRELRKAGHRIRMSASQIRLLTLFLERRGELVTREEIVGWIWTDTATIDVAGGVNTAIKRLRENLGDDSASPRFLETLIGLGYRFIAPVDVQGEAQPVVPVEMQPVAGAPSTTPEAMNVSETETTEPGTPHEIEIQLEEIERAAPPVRRAYRPWIVAGACVVLAVAGLATLFHFRHRSPVVAPEPARTKSAQPESVDGAGVFTRVTSNRAGKQIAAAALSPDGQLLAYADSAGIRIENLANRQMAFLAIVPVSEVSHIAWFPNGSELAVSGLDVTTKRKTIWLVPFTGLSTSVMADNADLGTVSPDGSAIAFSRAAGKEVWLAGLNGMNLRRLVTAEPGSVYSCLLWSPDGRRLMLASHSGETTPDRAEPIDIGKPVIPENPGSASTPQQGHWLWSSMDAATGKLLAREENVRVESAVMSPDGTLHYVTGASPETSLVQQTILSVQTDLATGRFLGTPAKGIPLNAGSVYAISASRDGSRTAVIGRTPTADIFTALLRHDHPGSMPVLDHVERLTAGLDTSYPHAWMSDGRILYESSYEDMVVTYAIRHGEASPTIVAQLPGKQGAAMAQVSPDGKWIVFLDLVVGSNSVYRVPAAGGTPEQIPGTTGVGEVRCARTGPVACVLHKTETKNGVRERLYFALDPVKGLGQLLARTPWEPARHGDWGLSPDGSTAVVATHAALHPALKFLKLDGSTNYEKTLPLPGHGAPLGAGWTADGKALFVESRAESSFELLYVTLNGQVQVLRKTPSLVWAIPSPDGTQIAFPDYTTNTNVWVSGVPDVKP